MNQSPIAPEQLEKLLSLAATRLNTTPDKLKTALHQEGLGGVVSNLSPGQAARAGELLEDKDKLTALLRDPAVRRLINQLLD